MAIIISLSLPTTSSNFPSSANLFKLTLYRKRFGPNLSSGIRNVTIVLSGFGNGVERFAFFVGVVPASSISAVTIRIGGISCGDKKDSVVLNLIFVTLDRPICLIIEGEVKCDVFTAAIIRN
jgi:hypothetical protein